MDSGAARAKTDTAQSTRHATPMPCARDARDDHETHGSTVGQVQPGAAHHEQARQGQRARDQARGESTAAEGSRHGPFRIAEGAGGQVDSGQIAGEGYGEHPDQDRSWVQPGCHQVPGGVADRHPPEGDGADRRAEGERGQHGGEREQRLGRLPGRLVARGPRVDVQVAPLAQWHGVVIGAG
jgi:hypothetical protein